MRWLIARYQPTSLFSLKHGDATSTGGKSLLIPTPFAIRMALLDVAIRVDGIQSGPQAFEQIKSLSLAVQPPAHAAVSSIFVKVLKPEREAESRGREMAQTIAFREYVHLVGVLVLAFGGSEHDLACVATWLRHVTYFGKRGSFFQLLEPPVSVELSGQGLPRGFAELERFGHAEEGRLQEFPLGMIQRVDDWGASLTYAKVNIFNRESKAKITVGEDRIRMDVMLPYRLVGSSRGYSLFRRFEI